jgi:hypothetical protein
MTVVNRDSDSDELETSLAGLQVLLVVAPVRAGQAQDPAGRRLGNHTRCHRLCVQAHLRLSFVHSFTTSRVMAARSALCGRGVESALYMPGGYLRLYRRACGGASGLASATARRKLAIARDQTGRDGGTKKVMEENENPRLVGRTTSPASIMRTDAGELPVSAASGEQVKPGRNPNLQPSTK